MTSALDTYPPSLKPIVTHVLDKLKKHQETTFGASQGEGGGKRSPLFVAFQGPQGSGKTHLTSLLRKYLEAEPHCLKVAVLSIDDLYLTHAGLVEVAAKHSDNFLLSGRGQPGTHDVALGVQLLSKLKEINKIGQDDAVRLPFFDKSLFAGEGDRVQDSGNVVHRPLDIVVFEGWCVGFYPLSPRSLEDRYESFMKHLMDRDPDMREKSGLMTSSLPPFTLEQIKTINEMLWSYLEWWSSFRVFVQIAPPDNAPYSIVYKWRLQQEHAMKAKNGGKGLTDEQVKTFIDRYIPGYVFFLEGIQNGLIDPSSTSDDQDKQPKWKGNGLKVTLDEDRALVATSLF
ncbi:P-loop containing nucleoside triphosphate hydrolase protein [Schizopora paradoxa]|uniref:p-loop containing nucleoside triphosphate hydrolase protein n=1 Tax=Schizopora paradoxa TaxID=27342 RepID=A0A0H2S7P9_9AGAM|nr:P-loop containing nucleoside triphosphate hydrolase protein [Schizopora paradoxa]